MPDGSNDVELFQGPKPSEKREMSDEQFREEMRKAQQTMQQLQREEGQVKAYDFSLAAIIVQFLAQPQNTDLFLLVSRVVALNLPSEFIIAILSLVDAKAHKVVEGYLAHRKAHLHSALALRNEAHFSVLTPDQKMDIENWIRNMEDVALRNAERILETIFVPSPERQIYPPLVQLATFILRNYLTSRRISIAYEDLRVFMERVLKEVVGKISRSHLKLPQHQ